MLRILLTCFVHSLKMCMFFSYNPCFIFFSFFFYFLGILWVPCDFDFSYNFKPFFFFFFFFFFFLFFCFLNFARFLPDLQKCFDTSECFFQIVCLLLDTVFYLMVAIFLKLKSSFVLHEFWKLAYKTFFKDNNGQPLLQTL